MSVCSQQSRVVVFPRVYGLSPILRHVRTFGWIHRSKDRDGLRSTGQKMKSFLQP